MPPKRKGVDRVPRTASLRVGRTIGVAFDHREDFFAALEQVCRDEDIRYGYIPMFLAGFSGVDVVGTCDRISDPDAPLWSKVHLETVEALGCGTIAFDRAEDRIVPHVHVSVGLKGHSATAHTSHLVAATVQFLTELLLVEVLAPEMNRPRQPALYDVPLLTFGNAGPAEPGRTSGRIGKEDGTPLG
jgi:predicted DNA-binding protein with PD1-like motif